MKYIHFYATKDDFLEIFNIVDAKKSLRYVLAGHSETKNPPYHIHGKDIPDLGRATSESSISCDTFLVYDSLNVIELIQLKPDGGRQRFYVGQRVNPETVAITLGGLWKNGVLISGRIATISETDGAQSLMKLFYSAIQKSFVKIRAFYVGPDAYKLMRSGHRLTQAEQSPPEYDLKE